MNPHPLDALLEPRSIAVVGASERRGSVGQILLSNLRDGGYAGELHAINRARASVQGLPARPDLRALGRGVDLAIVAVPAPEVAGVLADAAATGTRAALVLSAGFGEHGDEGAARQAELVQIAARGHVRLLGPNCLGLVRPRANVHAFFGLTRARPGRLALVSQSGAVCTAILDWAEARGIGFSAVVSLGAAADVGFGDVLDYLALDAETDAILLYVEGIDHKKRFMSGLRVAARMKPVVALKAGRHAEGRRAALSHTGALVGDDAVFDAALRRAGAVRAADLEQLFSAAELLSRGARTRGDRLAIITNAGGLGVMAADRVAEQGIALAELSASTRAALDAALPAHWSHGNPVDLIGDAPPERFARALAPVLADPGVDGALVLLSPQAMTQPLEVAELLLAAREQGQKPLLACFMGGEQVRKARERLAQRGLPEFGSPDDAVEAFAQLASFERNQRLLLQVPGPLSDRRPPELDRARALVARALADGTRTLSLPEAKALLAAFHVQVTPCLRADSADAAVAAAEQLGLPVAMKIDSQDISHKSDVGGVQLGLGTPAAVREAFTAMMAAAAAQRPDAQLRGVTLEPMVEQRFGRELIAGIVRDPAFGPVISVGAGGVLVELIGDASVALPPLNRTIAREMIERTRVRRLLGAFRGMPPADVAALETVLLRLSELACELPEVQELDINPLLVSERGAIALDARVGLCARDPAAARYEHVAIEPYPAHLARTLVLASGQNIVLRPIRPEDARIEQSFVRGLSRESRYFRFHHGLQELTPQMLVRFTQLDYDREMAFIAVLEQDGGEREIGVSRYVQNADGQSCEFALVVADAFQGAGIGTGLMQALIERARDKGLARMVGEILVENANMLELVAHLGFHIAPHRADSRLRTATLELKGAPDARV